MRLVFVLVPLLACAAPQPLTFVQMCDPQFGFGGYDHDTNAFVVAVDQVNARKPGLAVICGDFVDRFNTNSVSDFLRLRGRLTMPCLCTPGNHDVGNAPAPATLRAYREAFGPDYFAYRTNGWTFLIVDTGLWMAHVADETERQDAWLKTNLETAHAAHSPVIVIGHHPPFVEAPDEPNSYYNLPLARRRPIWDLFRTHGVVAYLGGHTHRTVDVTADGIRVLCGETTSRLFDGHPLGFRLWQVSATNLAVTAVPVDLPAEP